MNSLLEKQYLVQNSDKMVWRSVDGEAVLLNLESGAYYSFNRTATVLWSSIVESKSLTQAVRELAEQYGVTEEVVGEDANQLLQQLIDSGIIRPA